MALIKIRKRERYEEKDRMRKPNTRNSGKESNATSKTSDFWNLRSYSTPLSFKEPDNDCPNPHKGYYPIYLRRKPYIELGTVI